MIQKMIIPEVQGAKEEQNVKRRVYDALNVLIAAGVIKKEGKQVKCHQIDKFSEEERKEKLVQKKKLEKDISNNATHLAIRALQVALIKLNKVQASFTTINTIFLQLCIEHRFYKQAVKVIRMPIVNIIPKSQADDLDLAIYFYHAGEIMTECKYFKEAQQFFQDCLQFQFKQIYEVHQEAKKKLILLNIRKGKFSDYKEDKKQSAITRNTSDEVLNVVQL
ncbi:hypothetical protein PPERSA_06744 [Pseudocohnilembus persalinus]|uniref:E2F/DP family winged-helix DNA-binding domain-containing protein n=1 Tax=Pseudocohnilembus persalinus TaxID=266149 RepID=A0A0V0QS96_PSEPJ|nr:hypothetical protein PPERSA_06744 [Pseudocohnilembus persalinus]|eukprot:KRX05110.1 hypothetical protein PPERSA_06744 [Pseudocohnilembus persalinus]